MILYLYHIYGELKLILLEDLILMLLALIPLSEFSQSHLMKKYGVSPDPETVDIVSTASSQKEVILVFPLLLKMTFAKISLLMNNDPHPPPPDCCALESLLRRCS